MLRDIAAVTASFNVGNGSPRSQCYQTFLRHFEATGIPLYSVNLNRSLVWQKERLLNMAIQTWPPSVSKIIWIDNDLLVPESPKWGEAISAALDKWPIIQPWSTARFLDSNGQPTTGPLGFDTVASVPYTHATVDVPPCDRGLPAEAWPGFAWAARRDVLEEIGGLYEHDLSGPNDVLMSLALYGDFENSYLMRYSGAFRDHWFKWATAAYGAVQGNVGWIEAELTHLWHGPFVQRRYLERTVRLYEAGYDPAQHTATGASGFLELTDDCPATVRKLAATVVGINL